MNIIVSGSLAYDRIMDFPGKFSDHLLPDKLHILNVCFVVNSLMERFGGTAGNIAYSLALLGESPLILSTCGQDFDRYETWLKRQGLSLEGIKQIENVLTASAYITTDKSDNQITAFNIGAMNYPSEFRFDGVNPKDSLAIVSPGNLEDMLAYSRSHKERKIPYIFDPGQQIPVFSGEELAEVITGAELLVSNDYELEMISQATGLNESALLERCKAIITTLGEQGSRIKTPQGQTDIPAARASDVVDPTGAGDAYRAGLIKGLVMGKDLVESARLGAACASFTVEHLGTQEHSFTHEEFWSKYESIP